MTEDGRAHSAAFDVWSVPAGRQLVRRARRLDAPTIARFSDQVSETFSVIEPYVEREIGYSDDESPWEGMRLPGEYVEALLRRVRFDDPGSVRDAVLALPARWMHDGAYLLDDVFDEASGSRRHHLRKEVMWTIRSIGRR